MGPNSRGGLWLHDRIQLLLSLLPVCSVTIFLGFLPSGHAVYTFSNIVTENEFQTQNLVRSDVLSHTFDFIRTTSEPQNLGLMGGTTA